MRREMREGHFDESGFYVLNKDRHDGRVKLVVREG